MCAILFKHFIQQYKDLPSFLTTQTTITEMAYFSNTQGLGFFFSPLIPLCDISIGCPSTRTSMLVKTSYNKLWITGGVMTIAIIRRRITAQRYFKNMQSLFPQTCILVNLRELTKVAVGKAKNDTPSCKKETKINILIHRTYQTLSHFLPEFYFISYIEFFTNITSC